MATARVLGDRLAGLLSVPYTLTAGLAQVSASVGIAVAGDEGSEALLQRADEAMYDAKRAGGGVARTHGRATTSC